ncbi:MAG: hypothetical protein R3F19_22360 [Verrucomicrobiales bacterium]
MMLATFQNILGCATCIPNGDARIAMAGNSAILFMLLMLVIVLGSIISFIFYLMRRAKCAEGALAEGIAESNLPPNHQ